MADRSVKRLNPSDPHYVLLQRGLANRLRTMVGYWYLADQLGLQIVFHWDTVDPACNGRWHDLFRAMTHSDHPNIQVVDTPRGNTHYAFIGQETIHRIILRHAPQLIPQHLDHRHLWGSKFMCDLEDEYYARFRPLPGVVSEVDRFFRIHGGESLSQYVAVHIRRTDHSEMAKQNHAYTPSDEFDRFIDAHKNKRVFLATDSGDVQQQYQNRCLIYKEIPSKHEGHLRQTTLQDALVDLLIAARCSKFKGSGYSSFSHLIPILHRIHFKKIEGHHQGRV